MKDWNCALNVMHCGTVDLPLLEIIDNNEQGSSVIFAECYKGLELECYDLSWTLWLSMEG